MGKSPLNMVTFVLDPPIVQAVKVLLEGLTGAEIKGRAAVEINVDTGKGNLVVIKK